MSTDTERVNGVRPWTIKGIPTDVRQAAIAAADREHMTIGAWLRRAIQVQVQQPESGALIVFPAQPQQHPLQVPVGHGVKASLDDIGKILDLVRQLGDVTGKPVPRTLTAPVAKLLRDRIKATAG